MNVIWLNQDFPDFLMQLNTIRRARRLRYMHLPESYFSVYTVSQEYSRLYFTFEVQVRLLTVSIRTYRISDGTDPGDNSQLHDLRRTAFGLRSPLHILHVEAQSHLNVLENSKHYAHALVYLELAEK